MKDKDREKEKRQEKEEYRDKDKKRDKDRTEEKKKPDDFLTKLINKPLEKLLEDLTPESSSSESLTVGPAWSGASGGTKGLLETVLWTFFKFKP